jgi:methylmalonyl-CoA/ethylmalonyl-CoA epimerase
MRFDHAGIAAEDGQELAELFRRLTGSTVAHEETFDGMEIAFLDVGDGYFEIIEPVESGPIQRHLDREGPGLHHLAVETDDIEAALETAREADIRRIDDDPRPGAWGHRVAFLHPRDTGGVLLEFVEH